MFLVWTEKPLFLLFPVHVVFLPYSVFSGLWEKTCTHLWRVVIMLSMTFPSQEGPFHDTTAAFPDP